MVVHPGWFQVIGGYLKSKALIVLWDELLDRVEWFPRNAPQNAECEVRLVRFLDALDTVHWVHGPALMLAKEGSKGTGQIRDQYGDNVFARLASRLRKIDIPGPEYWIDERGEVCHECVMWLDRLGYAGEIRSLRVAEHAWKKVQRQYSLQRKMDALP